MTDAQRYREWKEMAKLCQHKTLGVNERAKMASRGIHVTKCRFTDKKCRMSGCQMRNEVNQ